MEQPFGPPARDRSSLAVKFARDRPEVLAGMVKIEQQVRLGITVLKDRPTRLMGTSIRCPKSGGASLSNAGLAGVEQAPKGLTPNADERKNNGRSGGEFHRQQAGAEPFAGQG